MWRFAGYRCREARRPSRRDLERFLADVKRHRIRPIVGNVFQFDDAPAALASMAGDRGVGKPVISLRSD